jgi:hypothetical protein
MARHQRTASDVNAAYRLLSAAMREGRLRPQAALSWAVRWTRGEDISVVSLLTPGPFSAVANAPVLAHSNQEVLKTLTAVLSGGDPEAEVDDEYKHLFPPGHDALAPATTVQEPGGKTHPVPSVGNTASPSTPYASAGRDRYDDADRITDATADLLWPAATEEEARARYERSVAAGALKPYSDADLHDAIFGKDAG